MESLTERVEATTNKPSATASLAAAAPVMRDPEPLYVLVSVDHQGVNKKSLTFQLPQRPLHHSFEHQG